MHDIWNPWHGCKKISEGCQNCYMYSLDKRNGRNGADIYRTKAGFKYLWQSSLKGTTVSSSLQGKLPYVWKQTNM